MDTGKENLLEVQVLFCISPGFRCRGLPFNGLEVREARPLRRFFCIPFRPLVWPGQQRQAKLCYP
jgi:hypothetical protein